MLHDDNYLYFTFLPPKASEFERLNVFFCVASVIPEELANEQQIFCVDY